MKQEKGLQEDVKNPIVKFYNIDIKNILKLTKKTSIIETNNSNMFFIKKIDQILEKKYLYLNEIGVYNILYPMKNKNDKLITKINNDYFFVKEYIKQNEYINDIKVLNMYKELRNIHQNTSFKRQLTEEKLRPKFEEITKQLDYKFSLIENFVRSVESKDLTIFSMPILSNYRYILDAKKELVRLQKMLIVQIKDKISVDYSFVHNNPKIDHLIYVNGSKYLTSIDHSKFGLSSLDMAKLYIETNELGIDFKSYIVDYYYNNETTFNYDYFRFLILYIYIKRLKLNRLDYVSAENFINTSNAIKKYFELFLDKKEEVEQGEQTYY